MPTMTRTIDIDASVANAWQVLRDVSMLPELSPGTVAIEVDGPLDQVGQTFRQTVSLAGRSWTSTWTVTDIDPPHRLELDGSLVPGVAYQLVEQLCELGPTTCRLEVAAEYRLPFGPLGRLASKLAVEQRVSSELDGVLRGVAARASAAPQVEP